MKLDRFDMERWQVSLYADQAQQKQDRPSDLEDNMFLIFYLKLSPDFGHKPANTCQDLKGWET